MMKQQKASLKLLKINSVHKQKFKLPNTSAIQKRKLSTTSMCLGRVIIKLFKFCGVASSIKFTVLGAFFIGTSACRVGVSSIGSLLAALVEVSGDVASDSDWYDEAPSIHGA